MTLEEAKAKLDACLDEIHEGGLDVWGWDDGGIIIANQSPYAEVSCEPRTSPVQP